MCVIVLLITMLATTTALDFTITHTMITCVPLNLGGVNSMYRRGQSEGSLSYDFGMQ